MGAWGVSNFENDDALDWIGDLLESGDHNFVVSAINKVYQSEEYLESYTCSESLAACEVVFAVTSKNYSSTPDGVEEWTNKKIGLFRKSVKFSQNDINSCTKAVEKITSDSELKELWEESDHYDQWLSIQNDLIKKLDTLR